MDILAKIKLPESRKLEFKESLPSAKKVVQTIVAFANGAGGELLVGVSDKDREITGVDDPFALEEQITSMVNESVVPPISPFFSIVTVSGKILLSVQILTGSNKPYYIKALGVERGVYVRIGSSNRMAGRELINELQRQARGFSYTSEINFHYSIEDLHGETVSAFFNAIGQEDFSGESLLKWNLAGRNNGDILPSVTGLVLFGKDGLQQYDCAPKVDPLPGNDC